MKRVPLSIFVIIIGLFLCTQIVSATSVFQTFQGGTGTSAVPAYGQVLVGNGSGTYSTVSTSSLGIVGGVSLVFGRTGAVIAQAGDYTTALVTEVTNLYFTNARAIAAVLTGYVSGAGTITSSDTVLSAIQKLNGNIAGLVTGVSSVFGRTGAVTAQSGDYSAFYQTAGNYITALTGDVTASGPGSAAATLATVNSNVGSFTNANITVNAKGLVTAAANGSGVTSVSGTTNQISSSGGTTPVISLPNLVLFPLDASTTQLSVFNTSYFGGTATTTINSLGNLSTNQATTTSFYNTGITSALALFDSNHREGAYGGASACSANNFVTALGANGGTTCGTSAISGVSLGSNLNSLSNDAATLTGTSYNGSAAISNWAINLTHANSWTGLQQFTNASSTLATISGTLWDTPLGTPAGAFLAVDPNGKVIATSSPSGGGAVSSVSNSDSTLTISPTTGSVVASLNLAHANSWTTVSSTTFAGPILVSTSSPNALTVTDKFNTPILNIKTASTTGDILDVASTTGTIFLAVTPAGLTSTLNASSTLFSASGPAYFGTTGISYFTAAGFEGIGSSTPWAALSVVGNNSVPLLILATSSSVTSSSLVHEIDNFGHVITGGNKPTISSCTGCTLTGDDETMVLLTGTSITSAVINFANTYTKTPVCIPTEESVGSQSIGASTTPTQLTLTTGTGLTTKRIAIICQISQNFTF